jgi:hypothetical protein
MEMIGKALDIGRPEPLVIPPWARQNFARMVNPLDQYAGGRLMSQGWQNFQGNRVMPWRKNRMSRGALAMARGRAAMGYGEVPM